MGEIKQLPKNVANQISAGEVVERPASIVKELIENSIDAGAENIEIKIKEGGRELIKVKDDGHGILTEDIEPAFNRYATSKIKEIDDLYSLYSLGFRGEALASISSVAEVEMLSRHKSEESGTKIKIKGGDVINKKPHASTIGTDVSVKNLFYNTPARYKYLKTTTTEFSHISRIVSAEAVASSEISFKLFHNGRRILFTPGNGDLKDTIFSVFGEEIADNLLPVDIEDRYIKLSGYIARPEYTRSSRSHELFFANGRPIYNNITAKAVEKAYSHLIDPGRKPIVFLFIKVNPILVDVNVHPAKRKVKFSRNQIIYDVIAKGIRRTLKESDPTTRIKLEQNAKRRNAENAEKANNEENNSTINSSSKAEKDEAELYSEKDLFTGSDSSQRSNNPAYPRKSIGDKERSDKNNKPGQISNNKNGSASSGKRKSSNYNKNNYRRNNNYRSGNNLTFNNDFNPTKSDSTAEEDKIFNVDEELKAGISEEVNKEYSLEDTNAVEDSFKFLGQIFNSYLLIETSEGLKIIDQHNAHERILFEKFSQEFNEKNNSVQSLLIPVKIELSPEEREIVRQYKDSFNDLGIDFSDFGGNTILVQEVPVLLKNKPTRNIIEEMIAELSEQGKALTAAEVEQNMIEYLACRTAVKAGKPLNRRESVKLIMDLFNTENPYRCPHSRPVMINISRDEIEKGIGRK